MEFNQKRFNHPKSNHSQLIDNLERIKACLQIEDNHWLDLLGVSRLNYLQIKAGAKSLSEEKISIIAGLANLNEEKILKNQIDFKALRPLKPLQIEIPERYKKAAYGRWRSSTFSLDFIEAKFGWKARLGCMKKFGLSERMVKNPFGPVSMRFMTDLCEHLHRLQFSEKDIFEMGSYTNIANRSTILGETYSQLESPKEIYQMFVENIELYERNCHWEFLRLADSDCAIKVTSIKEVAQEMETSHLGSERVCKWKEGFLSSLVSYLDLPWSQVKETSCVHRGDNFCLFEVDYGYAHVVNDLRKKQQCKSGRLQ